MNYKLWKQQKRVPKKIKLKNGDPVVVVAGKDKGTRGKIKQVNRRKGTVEIEGVNEQWDFQRGAGSQNPGEMKKISGGIHASNVMYYSDKAGGPIRLGYKWVDGEKVRYCHKHDLMIDKK